MIKLDENRRIQNIIDDAVKNYPSLTLNQILHKLDVVKKEGSSFEDSPSTVLFRIYESKLYKEMNERGSYKGIF